MSKNVKSLEVKRNLGVTWSIIAHKKLERDSIWFSKKSIQLEKKYSNHWIAVKNAKVIAVSPTIKGLETQLKKHNVDREESFIRRIPPHDMKLTV